MDHELANFIKYCLGYVKLTRERTAVAQQKYSIALPPEYFSLIGLLNGDTDGSIAEALKLDTFYKYDPSDVPEEELPQYEIEKEFATKIDGIYSKYRNDQFTKQIVLSFGYFEVELPIQNGDTIDPEAENGEAPEQPKTKVDRYPLFSMPIRIEKEIEKRGVGKYYLYAIDPEVQVNIGILQSILGDDLYFQLLEEMGKYEMGGSLSLPITEEEVFVEIWHKIKAQLRLVKAKFNEKSFALADARIALSARANYFLAEDLARMAQLSEEDLEGTALTSWVSNDDLNIKQDLPKERELFFPFLYDKYQLATLSVLGNRASIIQGPPGTGKSETISNILCHLAATGKRVLFVSQKAQALKVVKDKLKRLDVKYLYGYLPNPNSAQIGEEDEADGIAPQLSGLGSYIERTRVIGSANLPPLEQVVDQREKNRSALNAAIDAQRTFYKLHQEFLSLKEHDVSLTDFESFRSRFTFGEWRATKDAQAELQTLRKAVKKYARGSAKKEMDERFPSIDFSRSRIAKAVEAIKNDVAQTGYDRRLRLLRRFNNMRRNVRLAGSRDRLPREVVEYVDTILASDLSRSEQTKALDELHLHCFYYENVNRLGELETRLSERLAACGVSEEEFELLDDKFDNASADTFDEIKAKMLRVQDLKVELGALAKATSTNRISSTIQRLEDERAKRIGLYIQNIINAAISAKWETSTAIRQVIQRLARAFGKSKKAFKTFDTIRKDPSNFGAILDLIPIWIMELDDASRIIPLEPGLFDYVILDEASQCNVAYTLPVMYRAHHAVFVGDSEQMRDSTIMFRSNRVFDEMARRYQIPEDRQIKATGSAVQSVLDIAKNRGFLYRTLQYHYRSPAELIGFSNKYFYKPNGKELIPLNSNYLTYKDTNRVMLVHEVHSDWSEEISDNVNVAEARAILALFKELRADERTKDKSVGILAFFNAQADFIRGLFEKEGFKEEDDNYKISIIEGIQGDEKDIVIYSFVIRTPEQRNRYFPLTGEGGDIQGDINKGRVNVAFSRARLQVHCVVSTPPSEMPDRIWLKKYLEYVADNGEVAFHSTELKPFDSHFEEEFYNLLKSGLKRGYKIQNQVESCGFKIDFVVSNASNGERVAVECDGPCHFENEVDEAYGIHVQSDEERQRVLEAAGWRFCRIKYADWIDESFDRDVVVKTIVDLLN